MRYIEKLVEVVCFVILLAMVVLVFVNVVARYLFSSSITWAHEIARYAFVWLTFLGAAIGLARGVHIGMDLVTARAGKRMQTVMVIVSEIIVALFVYTWFRHGFRLIAINRGFFGPGSGIPMTLVYAINPIASSFMLVFLVHRIVIRLKGAVRR